MEVALSILLMISLVLIFIQDVKDRAVSIQIFGILAGCSFGLFVLSEQDWQVLWTNLAFVLLVLGSLFLYIGFKEKQFTNIFQSHFGLGDFVFFIAVTPLFANRNFILFFISGMILSAIIHLFSNRSQIEKTIPLAGYLALYIVVLKGIELTSEQFIFYTDIF